jgi:DNA-binding NarL/FixJ family response regulator
MIRLMIADDHPVVRQGLRRILNETGDIRITGEAASGTEVLEQLAKTPVDVLLLDISMPGRSFLDLLRQLRTDHPNVQPVVLSMHSEDQYAMRAFKAGAAGYVTKDRPPEELIEAIHKVYRGGKFVSGTLAEKLITGRDEETPLHQKLSNREYEVLGLLGSGGSIKAIAAQLSLSPKTVSTYRARILEKMSFHSNADIVRYCLEHGIG